MNRTTTPDGLQCARIAAARQWKQAADVCLINLCPPGTICQSCWNRALYHAECACAEIRKAEKIKRRLDSRKSSERKQHTGMDQVLEWFQHVNSNPKRR